MAEEGNNEEGSVAEAVARHVSKLEQEHGEDVRANRKLRMRFSKWVPWAAFSYLVWYVAMIVILLKLALSPNVEMELTLPLTAMIVSGTAFALAVLMPILNGIYRQNRPDRDALQPFYGIARDSTGNGS